MGHAKTVKNAAPGKKEKIFHPQSRKADQIARSNLRKDKLQAAGSKRRKRDAAVGMFSMTLKLRVETASGMDN
jgi:hypothetical protein